VRSIRPDATGEPVGTGPARRSLISILDRLDRLVKETVSSVALPPDIRRRGRDDALTMLAAAGDDHAAVAVLTLSYASELVQGIAVDLAAHPDDALALLEGIEAVTGLSRVTLARDVLRSPRFSELAPKVAVEVQLSLLVSFSDAGAVSLWTSGSDDTPRQLASAGTPSPEGGDARELAVQLLARPGSDAVGAAVGVRLDQRIERPAVLVAHARPLGARPPGTDHRMMLLRIVAPGVESALERDELMRRDRASEQTVISAVERRLARLRYDLHDGPQQDVHLLATDLALFREQLLPIIREDPNHDRIVGRLDDLAAELVALDGDLRRLASAVQSPFLPLGSLPESLRELTDAFSVRTGIEPDTQLRGDFSVLSESQQITLLALIREALSNVREHAQASNVTIAVSASPGGAEAEIVDDGQGFEPEATLVRAAREGHLGLVGMHERVRMLGGRTQIESRHGGPTVISVRLPAWPPPAGVSPLD
jgi:signal transduction histidine kinase